MLFFPSHLAWPALLDRERGWTWELFARTISAGKSLAGPMPLGRLDGGGLWTATLRDIQVSTPDQVRAFRALAALLDGGATPVVLTARDLRHFPAPVVNGQRLTSLPPAELSDGAWLGDGTGFASSVVAATVATAALLRATTLEIQITAGSALQGGEHFSIQHDELSHRLYRIGSVTVADGITTAEIRPPLRAAVDAGTPIEFDAPKCTMRLASPDAMDLSLTRRTYGQADVKFIESFPQWL